MFIEKNKNSILLTKKIFNKKISIAIKKDISPNDIIRLSKKELSIWYNLNSIHAFENELYNKEKFSKLLYNSIYLSNILQSNILQSNIKSIKNLKNKYSKFPILFIYESNKTEWSKIPLQEVEKIILNKKYKYKNKNEITEVENSKKAWDFLKKDFVFNEANIKRIYHILTKDLLQENWLKYPRGFKKIINTVNNSLTTAPENVSFEINKLLKYYKENKKNIFPLKMAFDFHLEFEKIHPFENWNWRIWRLLMNKILLANNLLPFIIFSENRQSYFNAIKSTENKWRKKYYKFMLNQYEKSINYFLK